MEVVGVAEQVQRDEHGEARHVESGERRDHLLHDDRNLERDHQVTQAIEERFDVSHIGSRGHR